VVSEKAKPLKSSKILARTLLLAALTLLAASSKARADIYVGASVGQSQINDDESSFDFDGSDTATKLFGGFSFFKFLGLEASHMDLGNPDDSVGGGGEAEIKMSGWDAFVLGNLPLGKHFEIFAKAGLVYWDRDVDFGGTLSGSDHDTGTDGAYGAGAAFKFGDHFAVRVEYEKFKVSDLDDVNLTSAGVVFRF
jgi:OOP family OmpA-OmpF porin